MSETWVPIPGFDGLRGEFGGRVKSMVRLVQMKNH